MAKREAVEATVTGNDQEVGFRALVINPCYSEGRSGRPKAAMGSSGGTLVFAHRPVAGFPSV